MKAVGTTLWQSPNSAATNESGFTGLPSGYKVGTNGNFIEIGSTAHWWSSTQLTTDINNGAYGFLIYFDNSSASGSSSGIKNGYAVRCIKD